MKIRESSDSSMLMLEESILVDKLQDDIVNFYAPATVNPYVALGDTYDCIDEDSVLQTLTYLEGVLGNDYDLDEKDSLVLPACFGLIKINLYSWWTVVMENKQLKKSKNQVLKLKLKWLVQSSLKDSRLFPE